MYPCTKLADTPQAGLQRREEPFQISHPKPLPFQELWHKEATPQISPE